MEKFDPYHRWLGIPPEEQPANYYRLLGIRTFESDLDVIENAADQRMAHLRTFQAGTHSAASQTILNEVAAAKVCLLTPAKKIVYDQQLQQSLRPKSPPPQPLQQAQWPEPPIAFPLQEISIAQEHLSKQTKSSLKFAIITGLTVALGLLVAGLFFAKRPNEKQTAVAPVTVNQNTPDKEAKIKTGPPKPINNIDHKPGKDLNRPSHKPPRPPKVQTWQPIVITDSTNSSTPDNSPAELPKSPVFSDTAPDGPTTVAAKGPKKRPPPSLDTQQKIAGQFAKVFRFSDAKTASKKRALAEKLLKAGKQAEAGPTERYVLFGKAMEFARDGKDVKLMLLAVDTLALEFEIDELDAKQATLSKFKPVSPEQFSAMLECSQQLIDRALAERRYEVALKLADQAYAVCRGETGRQYRKQFHQCRVKIKKLLGQKRLASQAEDALKNNPDDAEPNLILGRWYCFNQNNWKLGLPHLAKGDDEKLKQLALLELKSKSLGPADQVALGDAWWEAAKQSKKELKPMLSDRAKHWYNVATPDLSGVLAIRVKNRIEEIESTDTERTELSDAVARRIIREKMKKKKARLGNIYAGCRGSFTMCVNEKKILSAKYGRVVQTQYQFSKGDVITVRAESEGGSRCFCCVIVFPNGGAIKTSDSWKCYIPSNPTNWQDPRGISNLQNITLGDSTSFVRRIVDMSPVTIAMGIWGREPLSYLCYTVR